MFYVLPLFDRPGKQEIRGKPLKRGRCPLYHGSRDARRIVTFIHVLDDFRKKKEVKSSWLRFQLCIFSLNAGKRLARARSGWFWQALQFSCICIDLFRTKWTEEESQFFFHHKGCKFGMMTRFWKWFDSGKTIFIFFLIPWICGINTFFADGRTGSNCFRRISA